MPWRELCARAPAAHLWKRRLARLSLAAFPQLWPHPPPPRSSNHGGGSGNAILKAAPPALEAGGKEDSNFHVCIVSGFIETRLLNRETRHTCAQREREECGSSLQSHGTLNHAPRATCLSFPETVTAERGRAWQGAARSFRYSGEIRYTWRSQQRSLALRFSHYLLSAHGIRILGGQASSMPQ